MKESIPPPLLRSPGLRWTSLDQAGPAGPAGPGSQLFLYLQGRLLDLGIVGEGLSLCQAQNDAHTCSRSKEPSEG